MRVTSLFFVSEPNGYRQRIYSEDVFLSRMLSLHLPSLLKIDNLSLSFNYDDFGTDCKVHTRSYVTD